MALDTSTEDQSGADEWQHQLDERRRKQRLLDGLPWHGQGLMTEASERVTEYWFNTLGFTVLRTPKSSANQASRRISEKDGMRLVRREEREYVEGRFLAEVWEITRDEWTARRSLTISSSSFQPVDERHGDPRPAVSRRK